MPGADLGARCTQKENVQFHVQAGFQQLCISMDSCIRLQLSWMPAIRVCNFMWGLASSNYAYSMDSCIRVKFSWMPAICLEARRMCSHRLVWPKAQFALWKEAGSRRFSRRIWSPTDSIMALVKMFLLLLLLLRVAIAPPPSLGELLLKDIQGTGGSCKKAIEFAKASLEIPDDMRLSVAKMNPHNGERDLHRWVAHQMWRQLLPALYTFKLDISVQDEITESDHSAILPHEVFHSLYTFAPEIFRKIMGTPEDLLEFWDTASEVGDDWYRRHPVVGRVEPMLRVPFGFHGDDAGVHGQEQILVITWGSVALKQCTFDSRIVFTMLKVANILEPATTMHTVYRVLQWSFKALSDGKFPDADHNGKLFSKAHHPHRFLMAGKDLAGGMCGAFAEMRGDWKYLKEALHLKQHYGLKDLICHRCNVLKFSADLGMRYTNFHQGAPHRKTIFKNSTWMAMMLAAALVSPLLLIPGFHVTRICFDILHCLELGVFQVAVPSFMKEMTELKRKIWPGTTLAGRFRHAFRAYTVWRKRNLVKAYQSKPFRVKAWRKGKYPQITQLTMKGAALRSMVYWVSQVADSAVCDDHSELVAYMFKCFVDADKICRGAGRHFTRKQHALFCFYLEKALVSYNALAQEAAAQGKRTWKILPKHHAVTHYFDTKINPRRISCYQDEDMVGRVKKIYVACHGSTAPQRGLERYAIIVCLRWWAVLLVERLVLN